MLRVEKRNIARHDHRGDHAQLGDDCACFIEPDHVRLARGEGAIWQRAAWILLDRKEQLRHRFIEAPAEEVRYTQVEERRPDAGAGTEAQRGLETLDRDVGLSCPQL